MRLSDVARQAGCSAATVSRVINAPDSVNPEARARVEAAIRELGYTRNAAARALRSRRSEIVGVILPTLRQPIYADFVDGLQDELGRAGYALIVTTSEHSADRELFQARLLTERAVDGLVLVGSAHRPDLFALLTARETPFVVTFTLRPGVRWPLVGVDDAGAMRKVVEHLRGLGHGDFGILAGTAEDGDRQAERLRGATAALDACGLLPAQARIVQGPNTVEGGRRGLSEMLAAAERPTALVCLSDLLAIGAIIESRIRGIAVPADMSITGFDGLETAAQVAPALTTLGIPWGEIGRRAAASLVARLSGLAHPDRIVVDTTLVVRDSTGSPGDGARPARPQPRRPRPPPTGLRDGGRKVS